MGREGQTAVMTVFFNKTVPIFISVNVKAVADEHHVWLYSIMSF